LAWVCWGVVGHSACIALSLSGYTLRSFMVLILLFWAVETLVAHMFVSAIHPCTSIRSVIPVQTDWHPSWSGLGLARWMLGEAERSCTNIRALSLSLETPCSRRWYLLLTTVWYEKQMLWGGTADRKGWISILHFDAPIMMLWYPIKSATRSRDYSHVYTKALDPIHHVGDLWKLLWVDCRCLAPLSQGSLSHLYEQTCLH